MVTKNTLGSFRGSRGKTLGEAKERIFSNENLSKRLALFKDFCLPTYKLIASRDINFHGIFLINSDMPYEYLNEFQSLLSGSSNLHVVVAGDDDSVSNLARRKILELAKGRRLVTFRYDDDDALPPNYSDLIRSSVCSSTDEDAVVTLAKGYNLGRFNADEYGVNIRRYPLNAYGLAYSTSLENLKTIFDLGPHTKITEPIVENHDDIGWLATTHDLNDSRIGESRAERQSRDRTLQVVQKFFPQISELALERLAYRRAPDK